jgi:hypothetical protein
MRKHVTILIISLMCVCCNKKLDVTPANALTPSQIQTEEDVFALLFGGYSTLQNANAFGEMYNTLPELIISDDDLNWAGTFSDYDDVFNRNQIANNFTIYQVWANGYHTINIANTVLSKLDVVAEDKRDLVSGEAKFLRGVVYFQLVNLFAQPYSSVNAATSPGVPLILEPVEGYDPQRDQLTRASVEEIYTQVISDLDEAVNNLPDEADNARASRFSAAAFLSRVHLMQENYAEAAQNANEVIESGAFSLASSFDKAFNNPSNSSEDVFAIQQTSQSNSGTSNFGIITFYAAYPVGRGEMQVTEEHLQKYEVNDVRGQFFYEGSSISGSQGLMTAKWSQPYSVIPVIRLAEMYLTRAEANFRLGTELGASPLEDVNVIRTRSELTPLSSITTVDQIIGERFLELAFEGDKFLTSKRLRLTVRGLPYNDAKLVFPIPQREIDLNNATPQNPGY